MSPFQGFWIPTLASSGLRCESGPPAALPSLLAFFLSSRFQSFPCDSFRSRTQCRHPCSWRRLGFLPLGVAPLRPFRRPWLRSLWPMELFLKGVLPFSRGSGSCLATRPSRYPRFLSLHTGISFRNQCTVKSYRCLLLLLYSGSRFVFCGYPTGEFLKYWYALFVWP